MDPVYRGLFDAVPDAMILVDGAGRILLANRQAEAMFGYPAGALHGLRIERLMPGELRERHAAHRAEYMSQPRVRPMGASGQTLVGLRRDGRQFPVEIALSPVAGDRDTRYLASIRDISETQRARQALVRASYDSLVAGIGQLALESDHDTDVLGQVPGLLAEVLQADLVAVALKRDGSRIELGAAAPPDADPAALDEAALARALESPSPVVVEDLARESRPEARILREARAGSAAVMPLVDRDRAIGALLAWSRQPHRFDHDAQHLLHSVANLLAVLVQKRRSEEQLAHAQRLDALGQLTGGIAHDFNNLLTVMSGSLQLLDIETAALPAAQELVATALRSATRGAELTSKLLSFARKQRLLPQTTELPALLRDVETLLRRTLGESISLEIDAGDGLPPAFVDPGQLETALVNLALNARDAMPAGGRIDIQARCVLVDAESGESFLQVGHYVRICVADTGHGMTPEVLARAMEPFFTTKESGRGSGLGLSMVYGFARQSGGHLHVESSPGHGTRILLYLPVTPAHAAGTGAATALPSRARGRGETILVVEDDSAVRGIGVAFLQSGGYQVLTAADAADALAALEAVPGIALVFSDVMLGSGPDGKQLAAEIRTRWPDLPVLLTSGYESRTRPDATEFELLGKPYRREQLLARVARLLESAAAGTVAGD